MFGELRSAGDADDGDGADADPTVAFLAATRPAKALRTAIVQIVVADVSMSLDNVLAVAGVARSDLWVLIVGLGLSIAFMGLAAALIARLLNRHSWVAYVGLAVILYVAASMIYEGWMGGEHVLGLRHLLPLG